MSALSTDELITLTELLVLLLGIAITWAIYYGSDRAELPGDARIPDSAIPDDTRPNTEGRTLT